MKDRITSMHQDRYFFDGLRFWVVFITVGAIGISAITAVVICILTAVF